MGTSQHPTLYLHIQPVSLQGSPETIIERGTPLHIYMEFFQPVRQDMIGMRIRLDGFVVQLLLCFELRDEAVLDYIVAEYIRVDYSTL